MQSTTLCYKVKIFSNIDDLYCFVRRTHISVVVEYTIRLTCCLRSSSLRSSPLSPLLSPSPVFSSPRYRQTPPDTARGDNTTSAARRGGSCSAHSVQWVCLPPPPPSAGGGGGGHDRHKPPGKPTRHKLLRATGNPVLRIHSALNLDRS